MTPEALTAPEFELEGQVLRAVSVGQGDTEHSTVLHVPSAAAVIGGDVVYNRVHMMTAETDESVSVVAGHESRRLPASSMPGRLRGSDERVGRPS